MRTRTAASCFASYLILGALSLSPAWAQAPPMLPPPELDRLVGPIALYPDPLLAQVLAAATYSDQIPDAAGWADQHHYMTGRALTAAIEADQLPWDPSVQALLPFPSVLDMMASDIAWTRSLGDAFLAERQDVMDAVQRQRHLAYTNGYLRGHGEFIVGTGPYITIMPSNPAYMVVPYYDPRVVYAPPRPGFVVSGALRLGFGVTLSASFAPWGWGLVHFDWGAHRVMISDHVWDRNWSNRTAYVHPYNDVHRPPPGAPRPPEQHHGQGRSQHERDAARHGEHVEEEHH